MDRQDIAILINSCPKYTYLLEAHFGLLRRYAERCKWPVYFATEEHEIVKLQTLCARYNVHLLPINRSQSDFFESRMAGCKGLPESIKYVLPLQEDFLLERLIHEEALVNALDVLDKEYSVASIRLMPCPGPIGRPPWKPGMPWSILSKEDMLFSYQATIWRREIYTAYMQGLITQGLQMNPRLKPLSREWNQYAIRNNPAETFLGLSLLQSLTSNCVHLCWPRKASWANAVYWCPWPYRPTAIVKGVLEPWAIELVRREGFGSLDTKSV